MTDTENRQMLPEVAVFIEARDRAEETYRAARERVDAKYLAAVEGLDYHSEERRGQQSSANRERDAVWAQHRVSTNEAWNKLTQSSDPLVRWIAENCKEYQTYALDVLKVLPATVDELDELAQDEDWCNIWDQFRDRAVKAGVIPGAKPLSPARQALLDYVNNYCCGLSRARRKRLTALMDGLVAEAAGGESAA